MSNLCRFIWKFAKFWGISLGRLTPHIFGKMIGASSWKKVTKDNE